MPNRSSTFRFRSRRSNPSTRIAAGSNAVALSCSQTIESGQSASSANVPGNRRTHIHVRAVGSFDEQFSLLFRDYLRTHHQRAREYADLKHRLAAVLRNDRQAYVEAKAPFIWETIRDADDWAQSTGWTPGRSDA
jgi:GrpB-like predicted nucleotidyltransferase (UPF0157 family)